MNERRKHRWIFPLIAIVLLIGADEALAESKPSANKQAFAMLLARRAQAAARPTVKTALANGRTVHHASAPSDAARAAAVKPVQSNAVLGAFPATSVVPPSGYGSGRDAYVEALYPQILARAAQQSEVDYWARLLASGTQARAVANSLWSSQEHKSLQRSGEAPGIPLNTAYKQAYAWGLLHCKELEAAESRHHLKN